MGFRFQKRIKLTKNLGVNLSKSGITTSYRTNKGSLSAKGYSFKTGLSGVTYRKSFSQASKSGCMLALLIFLSLIGIIVSKF